MNGQENTSNSPAHQRLLLTNSLHRKGIRDSRVLNAMEGIPREKFIDKGLFADAYCDSPLPIGEGQTISQPYVVALMIEALSLTGREKVLEIGTGSGYQTAILCALSRLVISLERLPKLAQLAKDRLSDIACTNCSIYVTDGTKGWAEKGPYDAILVSAAAPSIPNPLIDQLALGGRCVIPVGDRERQSLILYERRDGELLENDLGAVRFVPLIGSYGWPGSLE